MIEITDEMIDAYLNAQRKSVEKADKLFGRSIGALHTDTIREACKAGLLAALSVGSDLAQNRKCNIAPKGYQCIFIKGHQGSCICVVQE